MNTNKKQVHFGWTHTQHWNFEAKLLEWSYLQVNTQVYECLIGEVSIIDVSYYLDLEIDDLQHDQSLHGVIF